MTDINRLIASLKRRSAHVKEFGDDITFVKLEDLDALVEVVELARTKAAEWEEKAAINYAERTAMIQHIAELESFRTAYMEWSDKTDWVRDDRRFDVVKPLGKHLADVLKAYIEHLEPRTVTVDADVNDRNQPGMVVAVHIDAGDFVKFRGQVYEVKETDFDDHDVTLWFVCGEALKCAAGCQIEVVSAPWETE
ncbi:hypothetical protein [Klebsiella pneumoniae]|uniref:hypothetical protein n=1 Tax=Klebsiella pneumoniae TaxID=573 RepID=UPI0032DA9844